MIRLTFKNPDGTWGVVGMNAENAKEKIYGCLRKLLDYENTGFTPNEVGRFSDIIDDFAEKCDKLTEQVKSLKSDLKKIGIGTEIAGYRIFAISGKRCVAQRIKNLDCEDYVVWYIDHNGKGVSNGVYFGSRAGAVDYFAGVI